MSRYITPEMVRPGDLLGIYSLQGFRCVLVLSEVVDNEVCCLDQGTIKYFLMPHDKRVTLVSSVEDIL